MQYNKHNHNHISALKLGLSNSWYTDSVSPLVVGHSKSYRKDCMHAQVLYRSMHECGI